MTRRADDNAATVGQRLTAYHAQTAPLIAYYEEQGNLQRIDAMGEIAQIAEGLSAIVGQAVA
jgi:adenylate kinase